MKLSDYIVEFLIERGISDVFGYPGGMVTHLMDSLNKYQGQITAHVNYHEQASAFSACGYAQAGAPFGVAYATSGPGATNLMTGIANAYFDSIPCLFLTGQVNTYESKGDLPLRQKGFQEMDIIQIVKPITKYAVQITNPTSIIDELSRAVRTCTEGRPGPVLLDIPMNIFRAEIDLESSPKPEMKRAFIAPATEKINEMMAAIARAKRPVLIAGAGITASRCKHAFQRVAETLQIPVVTSMVGCDCLPKTHSLNYGFIGAYGHRWANFITCHSDCLITIGTRLDCRQTGNDVQNFAPNAVIYRIDVDKSEFSRQVGKQEIDIYADIHSALQQIGGKAMPRQTDQWLLRCAQIRNALSQSEAQMHDVSAWFTALGATLPAACTIVTDVGQNQVWTAQYLPHTDFQRILFSGGHGAMGYALPAAIGAYYATKQPVICITGDGGLQMNIQEMQFLKREQIPVKIIVMNNQSLGMIRHFQEMYFACNYTQTKAQTGYTAPAFDAVARAYGMPSSICREPNDLIDHRDMLQDSHPLLLELVLNDNTYVFPKLSMGKPIYDQDPLISRELLVQLEQMCNF